MINNIDDKGSGISLFSREAWRYFIKLFSGQYNKLIATSFGSAAQAALILPVIYLIRYAFDNVIPQKNIHLLIIIGVAIFLLRLFNSLISVWLRNIHIKIINTAIYRLRDDLIVKLYNFSRSFHTREDQNIIHARIVQDTERLANMSNALISRIFPALIISFALCCILAFLNWILLLITISLVPIIILSNRYVGKSIRKRVYVFQRAFESFSRGIFFVLRYMDLTIIQSNQS